jgi:hypothetical protein
VLNDQMVEASTLKLRASNCVLRLASDAKSVWLNGPLSVVKRRQKRAKNEPKKEMKGEKTTTKKSKYFGCGLKM